MDIKQIWKNAQKQIMDKVSSINFDLWVKTLEVFDFIEGEFILSAVSTAAKQRATSEAVFPHIEAAIKDLAPITEKVVIIDAVEKEEMSKKDDEKSTPPPQPTSSRAIPVNPLKTFETFVVGKSNEFVVAACEGVAKNPGRRINPLFIYGPSGLGKTHLLHAIANHISVYHPKLKIAFVTCENFLNDYVEAIKKNAVSEFRAMYRNIDVLLIDDIHIIEKKTGTQEEFFHTFNDLYQNGRQIVLVSDRHADNFATLEERMRSRFKSGLIQDISTPDVETRMAILQKKATLENYNLIYETAAYLAQYAFERNLNIRDMEALLFKVIFYAGLRNRDVPTETDCREALQESIEDRKAQTTASTIIDIVCKYFNISRQDIVGKKRNREFVEPRMVAIYLISEFMNIPLANIGQILGGRDHSTVLHGRNKIASQLKSDQRMVRVVGDITKMINSE